MLKEFDTSLPSVRQVQNLIKGTSQVELMLSTGNLISGKILWQDLQCILIQDSSGQNFTVWKQALVYIKTLG